MTLRAERNGVTEQPDRLAAVASALVFSLERQLFLRRRRFSFRQGRCLPGRRGCRGRRKRFPDWRRPLPPRRRRSDAGLGRDLRRILRCGRGLGDLLLPTQGSRTTPDWYPAKTRRVRMRATRSGVARRGRRIARAGAAHECHTPARGRSTRTGKIIAQSPGRSAPAGWLRPGR